MRYFLCLIALSVVASVAGRECPRLPTSFSMDCTTYLSGQQAEVFHYVVDMENHREYSRVHTNLPAWQDSTEVRKAGMVFHYLERSKVCISRKDDRAIRPRIYSNPSLKYEGEVREGPFMYDVCGEDGYKVYFHKNSDVPVKAYVKDNAAPTGMSMEIRNFSDKVDDKIFNVKDEWGCK